MTKQSKIILFVIVILFLIYAFVIDIYCNKVHAATTSFSWGTSVVSTSTASSLEISRSSNFMQNLGEGKILFNFSLQGNATIYNVVAITYNNGTATNWQCDFGSLVSYYTNNETVQTATAICPIGYTGNQGLRKIFVSFRSNGTGVSLGLGDYFTYTNSEVASNDTTILNNINSNMTSLGSKMDSVYSKLNDINTNTTSKLNDILSKLNTNNSAMITAIQTQQAQQHQDSEATQSKIDNIDNTLKDDDITGNTAESGLTNLGGTFQTEQDFLLNLIKLPYTFFNAINETIRNQCSPLTIGTIFDYELVMPCINLNSLLGDVWTLIIDVIFAGVVASAFIRRVIKYVKEVLTLDSNALNTGGVKIW